MNNTKIWKDIQNPKTLNLFAGPCLAESHDVCQTTTLKYIEEL